MGDSASVAGADPAPAAVRRFFIAAAVICVLGALLRLYVYAANLSLWLDEALLSLNLIRRDRGELLDPLWWDQGAPPLFLLAEGSIIDLLGDAEWSLRLLPLVAGLAALPLFAILARRLVGAGPFALFALGLFALSVPLARYAAEVKQYGIDVLVTLIIVSPAVALADRRLRPAEIVVLAAVGGLLTLVSFTAALVTAGVLLAIVATAVERRDLAAGATAAGVAVAGAIAGVAYLIWAAPPEGLRDRVAGAFRAAEQSPAETASRYLQVTGAEFRWAIAAAGVLVLAGLVALALRDRPVFWLLCGPFIAAFAADIAGLYPFYQRFSLFTVPLALLLMAIGARALWKLDVVARVPALALCAAAAAGFAAHAGDTVAHGPQWDARQDLRPVLEDVAAGREPGDVVWIYPGARFAFAYYADRVGLPAGPPGPGIVDPDRAVLFPEPVTGSPPDLVIGTPFGTGEDLRADLSALAGPDPQRVWVVFSNVLPLDDESNPEGALFDHLESIGEWQRSTERFNASWYLFRLDPR